MSFKVLQMPQSNILVVDHDSQSRNFLQDVLGRNNFEVYCHDNHMAVFESPEKIYFELAIINVETPGISCADFVHRLREITYDPVMVLLTVSASTFSWENINHEEIFDVIPKPIEEPLLFNTISHALKHRRVLMENQSLLRRMEFLRIQRKVRAVPVKTDGERERKTALEFLGVSTAAENVRQHIEKVAASNFNVLLLGESGTGKDIVSRLIHQLSEREGKPFVKVNCPAIPDSLIESELFGHEAGAFTGATHRKPGRFELASGGTIFLDEIGDMPLSLQAKLLQCVEQKQFYSVGGKNSIYADVRIIAATNVPLGEMARQKTFRADLFYRLNEYVIHIPPLRERKDDLMFLAELFLDDFKKEFNCPDANFTPEMRKQLCLNEWPGNVRQLISAIRSYVLTGMADFQQPSFENYFCRDNSAPPAAAPGEKPLLPVPATDEDKMRVILDTLIQVKWNRRKAAEKLCMNYSTLRRRIKNLKLESLEVVP